MIPPHREWNAVLAHELRSPLAAILGYQELLDDGTFGDIPPAAEDALRRMRYAAIQMLTLIDALEAGDDTEDPTETTARDLIDSALSSVTFDADARGTRITTTESSVRLVTKTTQACRALALILGAAIKTTPGGTIHISVDGVEHPSITISGSNLDPTRDIIDPDRPLSGAGLRLELAQVAAGRARGRIHLREDGAAELLLPRLPG
ncbi:MAG: HAMP domain-containing histidine kinase [Gemmatimonadetes bacterium]|nr:HAMP domain-containing histidine kinase [Gemmatimonadota bacterium]